MSTPEPPDWSRYSHREIYDMTTTGLAALAAQSAEDNWVNTRWAITVIEQRLHEGLTAIGGGWEGTTAEAARAGISPLGQWALDAVDRAEATATSLNSQGEYALHTMLNMPPPRHADLPTTPPDPATARITDVLAWQTADQERANDEARARELMVVYQQNSESNTPALAGWTAPPQVVVDTASAAGPGGAGSGPAGSGAGGSGVVGGGAGGTGSAGGIGTGGGGPGGVGPGGSGAGTAGPGAVGPGGIGPGGIGPGGIGPGAAGAGGIGPGAVGAGGSGARGTGPEAGRPGGNGAGGGGSATGPGGSGTGTGSGVASGSGRPGAGGVGNGGPGSRGGGTGSGAGGSRGGGTAGPGAPAGRGPGGAGSAPPRLFAPPPTPPAPGPPTSWRELVRSTGGGAADPSTGRPGQGLGPRAVEPGPGAGPRTGEPRGGAGAGAAVGRGNGGYGHPGVMPMGGAASTGTERRRPPWLVDDSGVFDVEPYHVPQVLLPDDHPSADHPRTDRPSGR